MKIASLYLISSLLINSYFLILTGANESAANSAVTKLAELLEASPVSSFLPTGKQIAELTPAEVANLKLMLAEREALLDKVSQEEARLSASLAKS